MRFTSCYSALDLLTISWVLLSKPVDPKIFNEHIFKLTKIKPKELANNLIYKGLIF